MLRSIQVARALAVLAVVVHHFGLRLHELAGGDYFGLPAFLDFGYAGVDLFFVISGFIIAFITDRDDFRAADFFLRRAIRILPIYWVFTLVTWWGRSLVGNADFTAWRIFASFAVLPQQVEPIVGVGWSLELEAMFYVLFGVTAATLGRRAVIPVLAALCVAAAVMNLLPYRFWDWRLFSLFHFEFLAGVALYRYRHLLSGRAGVPLVAMGLLGFPLTQWAIVALPGPWRVLGFGLSSVLLLGGLSRLESRLAPAAFSPLVRLGDASFVLYLGHAIILPAAAWTWRLARMDEGAILPVMALGFAVSIAFALLFHRWFERPLLDALHGLMKRKGDAVIPLTDVKTQT